MHSYISVSSSWNLGVIFSLHKGSLLLKTCAVVNTVSPSDLTSDEGKQMLGRMQGLLGEFVIKNIFGKMHQRLKGWKGMTVKWDACCASFCGLGVHCRADLRSILSLEHGGTATIAEALATLFDLEASMSNSKTSKSLDIRDQQQAANDDVNKTAPA